MSDPVLSSEDAFRAAFEAGLAGLLDQEGLGLFILALANATFEPGLHARLRPRLAARFELLAARLRGALLTGRALADPEDDTLVFLKLLAVGLERIEPTRVRYAGPWEVQFNPVRAFRPPRAAQAAVRGIRAEFNPHGFHFGRRFLDREVFWAGRLHGREVALLYNKYPFVELHGLLVPERSAHRPQFLMEADHRYAWELTEDLGRRLAGFGLAYNAYGAYASVNHLHFQVFLRGQAFPVERPACRHNGGGEAYPVECLTFDSADEAWRAIDGLQRDEQPFNLLARPGRMYCLPRARQGTHPLPPWTTGIAWYEMAGGFTVFNGDDYRSLDAAAFAAALGQARIGPT
jgi:diadenosine tetraphosphate (Ap4A) HIT family hydrolase